MGLNSPTSGSSNEWVGLAYLKSERHEKGKEREGEPEGPLSLSLSLSLRCVDGHFSSCSALESNG